MQINDLIDRVERLDGGADIARDLRKFANKRRLGLVYEESKPEYVRLTSKPVVEGDLVNVLPPRGTMEDMSGDDEADDIWIVDAVVDRTAHLVAVEGSETRDVAYDDLMAVARFDQTIYCGLTETGRVERGGDKPYHTVINGENYHALELLLFPYFQSVDCIYIDPPYNTGAKDWKYNNNYVGADDAYRHSKWLTFMEDRLRLAKKLLNPKNSVLIVTIDEKEYLRLGLLLEQMFPEARIQMVSTVINFGGVPRSNAFSRNDEYVFVVMVGDAAPAKQQLSEQWVVGKSKSDVKRLMWRPVRRNGSNDTRRERPHSFFPIFLSPGKDAVIGVGDELPDGLHPDDYVAPEDCVVMWPIKPNGEEGCWRIGKKAILDYVKKGYLRVGQKADGSVTLSYIAVGEQKKVESGEIPIVGRTPSGVIITSAVENDYSFVPGTQWRIDSHNARDYGTAIITSLLGEKRFDYPKSLYAVEDVIRFFVSGNPDALIVDFFSGSGTTAHATMRLNRQDGGRRRSISVTNNEVSFDEAKSFVKQGLRAGDEEWEAYGIARYVTIPRVTAAITGLTPEGEPVKGDYKFTDEFPMADGFEENAVFYDLKYLEPSVITANLAFDEIAPLLWMRAGSVGPIIMLGDTDPEEATYEVTDAYGVLFDYAWAPEFIEECHERDVDHIFVVTDVDRQYRDMCAEFRGKDVRQLYKSYLRSFEIGQDR